MSDPRPNLRGLVALMGCVFACGDPGDSTLRFSAANQTESPSGLVRHVSMSPRSPDSVGAVDPLQAALATAEPGTEIRLLEGHYLLDNPITVRVPRILLRGEGSRTVLRPRNVGRPVFEIHADSVAIENLVIDATTEGKTGRSTFGIWYQGCTSCRLSDAVIAGTGASSVWGENLVDFRAERNRILDAGDDAFFLNGEGLWLGHNIAIRFLDEAVDISYEGRDVILQENCFSSGRIGIAIAVSDGVVNDNVLEDLLWQGMFVGSTDARGVVSGNTVRKVGRRGMILERSRLVSRNRIEGPVRTGIRIRDMDGGIVQENIVVAADTGFWLRDVSGSLIHLNRYRGQSPTPVLSEGNFQHNVVRANDTHKPSTTAVTGRDGTPSLSSTPADALAQRTPSVAALYASRSVHEGECLGRLSPAERTLLEKSLATRSVNLERASTDSEKGERIAEELMNLWRQNNPGFLSLTIQGKVMTTEVTPDLLLTLREAPRDAIGLVRAAAMTFGQWHNSFDVEWRLHREGVHVATIRHIPDPPNASISFVER